MNDITATRRTGLIRFLSDVLTLSTIGARHWARAQVHHSGTVAEHTGQPWASFEDITGYEPATYIVELSDLQHVFANLLTEPVDGLEETCRRRLAHAHQRADATALSPADTDAIAQLATLATISYRNPQDHEGGDELIVPVPFGLAWLRDKLIGVISSEIRNGCLPNPLTQGLIVSIGAFFLEDDDVHMAISHAYDQCLDGIGYQDADDRAAVARIFANALPKNIREILFG